MTLEKLPLSLCLSTHLRRAAWDRVGVSAEVLSAHIDFLLLESRVWMIVCRSLSALSAFRLHASRFTTLPRSLAVRSPVSFTTRIPKTSFAAMSDSAALKRPLAEEDLSLQQSKRRKGSPDPALDPVRSSETEDVSMSSPQEHLGHADSLPELTQLTQPEHEQRGDPAGSSSPPALSEKRARKTESGRPRRKQKKKGGEVAADGNGSGGEGGSKKRQPRERRRATKEEEAAALERKAQAEAAGVPKAVRYPKRQSALLIGFCGSGYSGMQVCVFAVSFVAPNLLTD